MHANVHETLFTMARTWKQSKCLSTDEWIKNIWYIDTMEYYLAIKKNGIESSVETWMFRKISLNTPDFKAKILK